MWIIITCGELYRERNRHRVLRLQNWRFQEKKKKGHSYFLFRPTFSASRNINMYESEGEWTIQNHINALYLLTWRVCDLYQSLEGGREH